MSKALDNLFFFGRPLSPLYSILMKGREKFYQRGIFSRHRLSVPVISVGNLVLGGTGKTPTVQHLARLLQQNGYAPAIVSRGYRGHTPNPVNVVSNGHDIFLSPQVAGDEPYMLAQALPGVSVLTGKRRIFPCRYAIDELHADVLLLDDGFQHLSVERDVDIVLFDSTYLAGNSRVFPGGPLREPVSALNRCHAFLLTGENPTNRERSAKFAALLQERFPGKPVFLSSPDAYELQTPEGRLVDSPPAGKFFGFCGIANPARFEKSLADFGIELAGFISLRDHAAYGRSHAEWLARRAERCGAQYFITSEKDSVKLTGCQLNLPLHVLKVHHSIQRDFDLFLLDRLAKNSTPPLS